MEALIGSVSRHVISQRGQLGRGEEGGAGACLELVYRTILKAVRLRGKKGRREINFYSLDLLSETALL